MSTSRRKFLALLGLGGATIATPAAATVIAHKLKNETDPKPQLPNPCREIAATCPKCGRGYSQQFLTECSHRCPCCNTQLAPTGDGPVQVPTPASLEEHVDRAARYQVKAENGDFFADWCPDKEAHAKGWADAAEGEMHKVETFAHDMGLITIWPGYYPEFYRRTGLTAKNGLLYVNGTHIGAIEADRIAHAMGHPNAESLVKALS